LGMWSSTYPGPYRAGSAVPDAPKPPPLATTRVTTARDLARALFRLQAAAAGQAWAVAQLELRPSQARAALGYLSLTWHHSRVLAIPKGGRAAEKDGWTKNTRVSAAIVYLRSSSRI